MSFLDFFKIKQELCQFLRNQDIISIGNRGVTTTTATGTFAGETSLLISRTNIKNIRSVVVATTTLTYGSDYTIDFYFSDSSVIKTKITFIVAQTGAYTITYDYGTDKIWPDFPRDDLSIDSYPRIAIDVQSVNSDAFGIGGEDFISELFFTIVVYGQSVETLNEYISTIRQKFMENASEFYYLRFIKPVGMGPLIQDEDKRQEIMSQNIDFQSMFNTEQV